jgi:hypothetical protein
MITVPELAADALGKFLGNYMRRRFGSSQTHLVEMVPSIARIAIECIGNSDALYHNVEHTMLVTLAGHDILRGRALHTHMPAEDYAHVIIACLTHDIGYVRGLFLDDDQDGFVVDTTGRKVTLPRGSSDAELMPYHVERSKLYVMERIEGIAALDKRRIARAIEGTRFPASFPTEDEEVDEEASAACSRSDRPARRSALYSQGQRALPGVRGSGIEPAARLQFAGRHRQSLSAILLEQRGAARADGDPLPERHLERPAVDRQSLQQRVSRRARHRVVRPAEVRRYQVSPNGRISTRNDHAERS